MIKLVRITTVPLSLELLIEGQMKYMWENGFDVYMISSPYKNIELLEKKEKSKFLAVKMTRVISPVKDFISLFKLVRIFRNLKPHIIHTHTPKAGVLGMLAGWISGVPIRLHTVAGLPLMETKGLIRKILEWSEKLTYACANQVYPNSKNLYQFIVSNNYCAREKLKVLGNGSSNGIDTEYFRMNDAIAKRAGELKKVLNIRHDDFVFVFVGRLVKDKGINELVHAFNECNKKYAHLKLLLVGPFEDERDPVDTKTKKAISSNCNIICTGFIRDIRPYLAASNVLVFPSYREGFPNVPLQAGCLDLPMIVTDINGCNEIVKNYLNGLVIPPKNTEALKAAMEKMITDANFRKKCAIVSRQLIIENYSREIIWNALLNEYMNLLNQKGINFTDVSKISEANV